MTTLLHHRQSNFEVLLSETETGYHAVGHQNRTYFGYHENTLLGILEKVAPMLVALRVPTLIMLSEVIASSADSHTIMLVHSQDGFFAMSTNNSTLFCDSDSDYFESVGDALDSYQSMIEFEKHQALMLELDYDASDDDLDVLTDDDLDVLTDDDLAKLTDANDLETRKYSVKKTFYTYHVLETWVGGEFTEATIDRYVTNGFYVATANILASENQDVTSYIKDCESRVE